MKTIRELAHTLDPERVKLFGAARRMAITATARAIWQLAGFAIDGVIEVFKAEAFTGIGHAARPPTSGKPEAIVIMLGDAKVPAIVAVRDEATRSAIANILAADETMIFNSQSFVHVKADGSIEARSKNGTAVELATKADLQRLRAALSTAAIAIGAGGAAPVVAAMDLAIATPPAGTSGAQWPIGTAKLKGE